MDKFIDFLKGTAQPYITFTSFTVFLILVLAGKIDPENLWWVVLVVLTFWFGETAVKKIGGFVKSSIATSVTSQIQPIQAVTQPAPTPEPVDEPEDEPVDEPALIPMVEFDAVAFQKAVDDAVVPTYTVKNDSTVFYTARTKLLNTDWSAEGFKQAAKFVLDLAKQNFRTIWGLPKDADPIPYATEHLNDNLGCTTCAAGGCTYPDLRFKALQMGQGYYTAYLDLIEMTKYAS